MKININHPELLAHLTGAVLNHYPTGLSVANEDHDGYKLIADGDGGHFRSLIDIVSKCFPDYSYVNHQLFICQYD